MQNYALLRKMSESKKKIINSLNNVIWNYTSSFY